MKSEKCKAKKGRPSTPIDARPQAGRIGAAIRAARERAGLTASAAAGKLSVAPATLSDWEHGRYAPRADRLAAIAAALGCRAADLLGVGS